MKTFNNQTVHNLWNSFLAENPEYKNTIQPQAWYFCDNKTDANNCANLVLKGIKQATSTSLWWFKAYNYALPKVGDLNIITNWNGEARAIIKTVKIEYIPFNKITKAYAIIEGEGDKSLHYWQKVHWAYYTREMKPKGEIPSKNMIIVFEQFKTIFTV
ncbi:ASCH domain-containing protein [Neotamlana laminarinivorans]|uniref:ASCH domain-containing protein n=1 Tax=Neotamlana laminarinivorans TaxID=2883124 RepID=A0A9X1I155_9FLAO|nr:ASCH domain-containing protein [Tamlana laminarinivorans]MCB4799531.1 ASCH domain-containing protein [Tamlana laminarinivorans]